MRTIELYRKHKAGEIGRDRFLYEVRRDKNLPWVTNVTSYDDAVKILKNKGIISEAAGDVDTEGTYDIILRNGEVYKKNVKFHKNGEWYIETASSYAGGKMPDGATVRKSTESLKEADENVATDPAVDRVNPYFLKKGVEKLLSKEEELTNDSYINALNKAAKQLQKNPHAFDKEMFANAEDVEKADAKLETEEVKKANHKDKANEMKKVKVKSLKEAAITELTDYLKKKDSINEDSHYKHNVGSEVHTPDGPGKVVEIVGGTLTIEMEDGTQKDFQINTIDHFTQKASEEQPVQQSQAEPSVKDMWANWKGNTFGGMVGDPEHFKKPLDFSKLKEYIAKHKDDKGKMEKLKKAIKERIDVVKGRNATTGEEEVLAIAPGGQGSKIAADYKSKGASSVKVKPVA